MPPEGLIRPDGKTRCIFEMADNVQARARAQAQSGAGVGGPFSSRYFQYSLDNIDGNGFFFFLPDLYQRRASTILWSFIYCLLNTIYCLVAIFTNPYKPTPKVATALELRVPETSGLFNRLLPVKHTHGRTDSLRLNRPPTDIRLLVGAILFLVKVVLDTVFTLNRFTYC